MKNIFTKNSSFFNGNLMGTLSKPYRSLIEALSNGHVMDTCATSMGSEWDTNGTSMGDEWEMKAPQNCEREKVKFANFANFANFATMIIRIDKNRDKPLLCAPA